MTTRAWWLFLAPFLALTLLCGEAGAGLVQVDYNDMGLGQVIGRGGGVGMTGNWDGTGRIYVIGGDLTSPLYTLAQSGTPRSAQGDYSDGRQNSRAVAAPLSGDVWFSYLVNVPDSVARGGLSFNQSSWGFGEPRLGAAGANLFVQLPDGLHYASNRFTYGQTALVVGQMQIGAGNDTIQVWVSPDLAAQPDISAHAPAYYNASTDFADSISRIGVASYHYHGPSGSVGGTVDNVMLSDTATAYQDVTGSPATTGRCAPQTGSPIPGARATRAAGLPARRAG